MDFSKRGGSDKGSLRGFSEGRLYKVIEGRSWGKKKAHKL